MKKLLLILALIFASQGAVKASHVLGGEIRWECLGNGRFVFFAKVFRDCTGINYPFDNKSLQIVGNPLPRSSTNSILSSIVMKPDSNTWINNRYGDTSPTCKPGGQTISCGNGDEGAIQQFFFQSDPVQLRGTPPSNGWKFYLVQPCCRPNVTNLASGGTMMLRAIMYPDAFNSTTDQCKDSSPEFLALPTNMLCRGYEFTYNHTAIDKDLDSLVYSWDRTYNSPPAAPQPVPYASGYSFNNPTPDKTFNTQNIPAQLDPITGQIKMGVWSGSPLTLDYLTVVRVDAYRDKKVIASVFREIPFVFFDCERLPNGQINRPPEIFIDGDSAAGIVVDIVAGQQVRIPFQASDLDFSGGIPGLQRITVEPAGFMFSRDLQNPFYCYTQEIEPCAYLRNQDPVFNGVAEPPRFEISGYAGIATEFVWDTRCHHIQTVGTGIPGQNEGIYNFVMRTYDDHCKIPGINYPTITVKVRDPLPLEQPIMKGISVNLDGSISHQWVPPLDSATSFYKYRVEFIQPNDGFPPNPNLYQYLDTNERRYQQERRTNGIQVYVPDITDPNLSNVFNPITNKDWYIRMQTISGCEQDVPSIWSEPARVMELTATPDGNVPTVPLRAEARLSWNRAKPISSFSHPYYRYVSPTRYYIYTNDAINFGPNPGDYSGHDDLNNWLLRGNTYTTNFSVPTTTCSGFVAFRVEARDTVITFKQGTAPRSDTLDTLVFSTFTMMDTMYMKNPGFIPDPQLDTIEVMANGNIKLRVDAGAAGTTGEYRFYENAIAPGNLLGTIVKPDDSIIINNFNGQANAVNFVIEGIDECDTNVRANSAVYPTIIPGGSFPPDPCAGLYDLSWVKPSGFPGGTRGYRIYRRLKDDTMAAFTNWELVKTVTNGNTTTTPVAVQRNTDYIFKVEAYDADGAVNISAEHNISIGNTRTYEVVPAPELRCSYVNDNGSVTLFFLPSHPSRDPSIDSTRNWVSYKFQYRQPGNAWTDVPAAAGLAQDADTLRITGINAINNMYEFRATSLSGCSGSEEAPYNTINLINPTATAIAGEPDSNKFVRVTYTGTGVSSDEPEFIRKAFGLTNYFGGGVIARVEDADPNVGIDAANGFVCDTIANYVITKADQLSGCISRSRPDTARIIDQIPPPPQKISAVSYELYKPAPYTAQGGAIGTVWPNGDIVINWNERPSADTEELLIFSPDQATGQNDSLNQLPWDIQSDTIPNVVKEAVDSSYYWSAQSIDACGRKAQNFDEFDYHKNIDLDVDFLECDSTMNLSWNGYYYFQDSVEVEYTIERLYPAFAPNGDFIFLAISTNEGTTTDTTFSVKVDQDSVLYGYRVVARPMGVNGVAARSSWDTTRAVWGAVPRFNYLSNVTVLPNKQIEMTLYRDTTVEISGLTIWRGNNALSLEPYEVVNGSVDQAVWTNTDSKVLVDDSPYYYKIVLQNECGNDIDTSNIGSSIHLTVEANNEALTNVLRWNAYDGWDEEVEFYNIYRGVNGVPPTELYATVPANGEPAMQFVDDVYDNIYSVGNYIYRVEAVQGNLNPQYTAALTSATSNSNEVSVTQDPLFYVPNAFAPDGANKTFGPSGQFFDFTKYEMMIYNRWGELIFESRDIREGWDGTVGGEDAPLGSYVYTIRFIDANGNEHRRKGTVTLVK